ncbi:MULTISPECIES: hypothetical protein [Streptomyces]|uniref:Uncharacterized protein n=5 Tax=Streptomyces TaxID=1883 RepID=A0ABW9I9I5_STRGJ|nr:MULTISPECIES: hypothetical protein [Streptomyces]MBP5861381.1 hypothetical protein [Streptomyces sp. LBUM 1484]MBP5869686.1 hypothetical protein [Streptomyces sp. LBUM 1485]MBP5908093.1 hypothetical protein [Streptomyces sp. LBUM 1478]MBP5928925.1 hypothetical protein [Streptomyces sp. LBUM 1479]KFG02878.1 hypothetical protein IQ61_43720 [Streptomyces scabiei]
MFHRIRRRAKEPSEEQRRFFELSAQLQPQVPPGIGVPPTEPEHIEPTAVVDDFLPPELRVPSHDQVDGTMMPWKQPLVLDGEMVACSECGTYRDWLILSTRDQIWLRCRVGHQQQESRLDTAWFNRNRGPADATHATFEDCLRHLGH